MCMAPKIPDPPPPEPIPEAPKPQDAGVQQAGSDARQRAKAAQGSASTILAGGSGSSSGLDARKTLLGG